MNQPIIITKTSSRPGQTLAIFAGIHGNETVGLKAFKKLLPNLTLTRGTVYFVIANPPAVTRNVRYLESDLNRAFYTGNNGVTQEADLARSLMVLLNRCDALLDLHSANEPGIAPFIICEKRSLSFAKKFAVKIISTGWNDFEVGSTESYMDSQGKIAICLECGSSLEPEKYLDFTQNTILTFLGQFGLMSLDKSSNAKANAKIITVSEAVTMSEDKLKFTRKYSSFEKLVENEVFAYTKREKYRAKANQYIIFPRPSNPVGSTAFLLGEWNNHLLP